MSKETPPYPSARNLLEGRTVVVTAAAGTGIGFAAARRCVEEGARVLISDLHERRLAEAAAEYQLPADVADWVLFNPKYFEVAFKAWYQELG